jgi:hypothetical protein
MLAAYRRWRRAGAAIALACASSLVMAAALVLATAGPGQAARAPSWTVRKTFGPGAATSTTATSSRDVWVTITEFSNDNRVSVERWDGLRWNTVPTPLGMFTDEGVVVGASSPASAWVFTYVRPAVANPYSVAWHWTGRSWRTYRLPGGTQVDATAVLGPRDAWAFGTIGSGYNTGSPYVARFNGRAWRRVAAPMLTLTASALSAHDIWVAGPSAATENSRVPDFVLARWTGRGWQSVRVPRVGAGPGVTLGSPRVLALSERDVWLVLTRSPISGTGPSTTIALHYDGGQWSQFAGLASARPATSNLAPDGKGGFWVAVTTFASGEGALVHFEYGRWDKPVVLAGPRHYAVIAGLASWPGSTAPWAAGWTGHTTGNPNPQAVVYSYQR